MIRVLHSSDWHLGRPFAGFDGDLPANLRAARLGAIARLAETARADGAGLVLVAGDVFDSEAPDPRTALQALGAMAEAADLRWALLPGNHDPDRAGGLWERLAGDAPPNLLLLREPRPVEAAPGVWLLPAPLAGRDPGRDLTAWMEDAATPEGAVRIGVAHGSVVEFAAGRVHSAAIAPDRAARAGLDYLALGDWHSVREIGPATWYCGTPEPDRFGLPRAGRCLSVAIPGPGAPPEVAERETARHAWVAAERALLPGEPPEGLEALLPADRPPREVLLSLALTGRATLSDRAAWEAAAARLAPRLAHLALATEGLEIARTAEDLDRIDRAGALRRAAEALEAEAEDAALAPEARRAARDALDLLFSWCVAEDAAGAPGA